MNSPQLPLHPTAHPECLCESKTPPISFSDRVLAATRAWEAEEDKRIERSFNADQLTRIALQIDPDAARPGDKARWFSALRLANKRLLEAEEFCMNRRAKGGFLKAVEAAVTQDELERASAQEGKLVDSYVRLTDDDRSDFDELLKTEPVDSKERKLFDSYVRLAYVRLAEGDCSYLDELLKTVPAHSKRVHSKLANRKIKAHLSRLKELGFEFYPLDHGHNGAVILKSFVARYAKIENDRMRKKDAEQQRKRRAIKKIGADGA